APSARVRNHLAPLIATLDQRAEVTIPRLDRVLHRACVSAFVVDAADATNAAPGPALMIENLFDDMRLNAEVAHARGTRSSQIVQHPRPELVAEPRVERLLVLRPTREAALRACAEQQIAADDRRR